MPRDGTMAKLSAVDSHWGGESDLPHTVHRINSMVASFSLVKSKLIAIAACATMMVPT